LNQITFKISIKEGNLQIPGKVFDNNKTEENLKGEKRCWGHHKLGKKEGYLGIFETFTCGLAKTLPKKFYPFSFTKLPITSNTRI